MSTATASVATTTPRGIRIRRWDPPRWLAYASVAAVAVLGAAVAWGSTVPVYFADEVGMLGNALTIARPGIDFQVLGSGYMPGLSLLLVPLWWFFDDPGKVYVGAIAVNWAVSVAVIWPMSRIARHFGARPHAAVIIASVLAFAPARMLHSNFVMSEHLLQFTVALAVWAGLVMSRRLTLRSAVAFGAATGLIFLAHGRALPLLVAGGLILAAVALRNWRIGTSALAVMAAVVGASYGLYLWITSQMNPYENRAESVSSGLLGHDLGELAHLTVSQVFAQSVGWLGLAVLGVVALIGRSRANTRAVESRWLLAATLLTLVFTVLTLAGSRTAPLRLDLHVYGRYLEIITPTLALIGLAVLAAGVRARTMLTVLGGMAAVTVVFTLYSVPRLPERGGWWEAVHIPGLAPFLNTDNIAAGTQDPWFLIGLVSIVAVGLVMYLSRRAGVALALVALLFASMTWWVDRGVMADTIGVTAVLRDQTAQLDVIDVSIPLSIDLSSTAAMTLANGYAFWAVPRTVLVYEGSVEDPPSEVIATISEAEIAATGRAWPMAGYVIDGVTLWVVEGDLRDELAEQGYVWDKWGQTQE